MEASVSLVQQMAVCTHRAHLLSLKKSIVAHQGQLLCDIPLSIVCFWQMLRNFYQFIKPYQNTWLFFWSPICCGVTHGGFVQILMFRDFLCQSSHVCCVWLHWCVGVFVLAGFCQQTGWVHLLAERCSRNHRQLDATQSWYRQPQTLPGNSPCE